LTAGFAPGFALLFPPGFAANTGRALLAAAEVLIGPRATVPLDVPGVEVFLAKMVLPAEAGRLGEALWAAVISRGKSGVGEYTTIFCPSPSSLVAESRLTRARSPGARP
jgi:hypothetical protein